MRAGGILGRSRSHQAIVGAACGRPPGIPIYPCFLADGGGPPCTGGLRPPPDIPIYPVLQRGLRPAEPEAQRAGGAKPRLCPSCA
jgi:hypothetical protein